MSRFLLLDSAPLELLTHPQRSDKVAAITEWLSWCILSARAASSTKDLWHCSTDAFVGATPGRYLPLSDEAPAGSRTLGESKATRPTNSRPLALDIDVTAAQALSFGPAPGDVIIATTNAKHLSQFVTARDWQEIVP